MQQNVNALADEPYALYAVNQLFITTDDIRDVLKMRLFNLLIGYFLTILTLILSPQTTNS